MLFSETCSPGTGSAVTSSVAVPFGAGGTPEARAARRQTRRSILDWISGEVASLRGQLGTSDRVRLDRHEGAVLEERRRERRERPLDDVGVPAEPPLDAPEVAPRELGEARGPDARRRLRRRRELRREPAVDEDHLDRAREPQRGDLPLRPSAVEAPRRPLEASGTSGMKAAANGVPNLSILDGWWDEGYEGTNGWAIGQREQNPDEAAQDQADAHSLYDILENEVVPLYYERDASGLPLGWIERMRNAMTSSIWRFSTHRMLEEYIGRMYLVAARGQHL